MNSTTLSQKNEVLPHWGPILFLSGFCLILLQFFMIREITALLAGTELVIFLVAIAYFSGYSVGYAMAGFLSIKIIRRFAIVFWLIHLTLPFSLRYWMGYMTIDLPGVAFVVMLFFTAFAVTSFYSLLLPRFIDLSPEGTGSLAKFYSVELAGAVAGLVAVFLFGSISWMQPIMYQTALAAIVALLLGGKLIWAITTATLVIYASLFTTLNNESLGYHYTKYHGLRDAEPLYSVNSPYQKVDIIKSKSGRKYIFLDGKKNYGNTSLRLFNVFLTKMPANLVRPTNALVIGAGSLESVRNVAQVADWLTIVDIDQAVPEGSRKIFADVNWADHYNNWNLVIDDAKSFLAKTDQKFDLVTMDVPAPLQIQTGLIHSVEFYQMIKDRLTPNGVLSISLCGNFKPVNTTPRTVAAALTQVFEEVIIHSPDIAKRSFAVASRKLPFTKAQLAKEAQHLGAKNTEMFDKSEALIIIDGIAPITFYDLSYPLKRSIRRVERSFFKQKKARRK